MGDCFGSAPPATASNVVIPSPLYQLVLVEAITMWKTERGWLQKAGIIIKMEVCGKRGLGAVAAMRRVRQGDRRTGF